MSKTKKFAAAAVSIVLASSMCLGLAACGDRGTGGGSSSGSSHVLTRSQTVLNVSTDANGDLYYTSGLELPMNMGQNSTYTISFRSNVLDASERVTLPDGVAYSQGDMKPAWKTLASQLDVTITDVFTAESSSEQISQAVNDGVLGTYAMISGDATAIVNEGSGNNSFLDLSLYLDYMPHFQKFLEDNPIVYMSLTSNTETGAIYYAPYFDGNDDIEKYELANQHWVTALLDDDTAGDTTVTFASQATAKVGKDSTSRYGSPSGTSSSVESFMDTTGEWWVESSNPEDVGATTVTITVSYDDALAAAKASGSALNTALLAVNGVDASDISALDSGNIVDLQNLAINESNGAVTGAQLLAILRAYIDVAYQDENGNKYYDTRSDVFNGYDAAWDVDLLVAFSRCVVTNYTQFPDWNVSVGDNDSFNDGAWVYAIGARQGNAQRQNDLVSLAGELYGVRGLTSRYQYTYIDSDGEIHDARTSTEMWEALDNIHAMVEEGLVYTGTNNSSGSTSYYVNDDPVMFMIYDYDQTQTANGGYALQGLTEVNAVVDDYNFAPINTPVSKWNDGDTSTSANADGVSYDYDDNGNKYMRFTESWRSVKNTGFGIPYAFVQNNPERLAACLAVIDYMFSNDGQIVMTYGQMSTTNSGVVYPENKTVTSSDNGWWYGNKVTTIDESDYWRYADEVDGMYYIKDEWADMYFFYDNVLYTGTYYKGEMAPTMTTANLYFYYGYTVNGNQLGATDTALSGWGYARNYTNYARGVIGSAQPMGNKLQSFEYQCTAEIGIVGADKVAASLVNGTISHVYLQLDNSKGNMWYTSVPTTLPYDSNDANYISTQYNVLTNTVFSGESGSVHNFANDVIFYGLDGTTGLTFSDYQITMPSTAQGVVDLLDSTFGMNTFEGMMQTAWDDIQSFYYEWIELVRIYAE